MKNAVFGLVLCFAGSLSFGTVFYEDFEDGDLNGWDFGGRELTVNDRVDIVDHRGSNMAMVFHDGWSETYLKKTVDYNAKLNFSFDLETSLYPEAPFSNNSFAHAGYVFHFLNENDTEIGRVYYASINSTFRYPSWNTDTNSTNFMDLSFRRHSLGVQDVLSKIVIDESKIAKVNLYFNAYCSSDSYNMHSIVWVDNIEIVPEPATLLLFGLGGFMMRKSGKIK